MSVAITKWIQRIGPGLRFCPNPLIKQETIDVLRDFCERTRLWHERLADITIVAGTESYALTSANGDIASARRVEVNGIAINPADERTLDRVHAKWRIQQGEVWTYYMGQDRILHLVYTPASAGTLSIWANLMPALNATEVQDFLFNDHRDVITLGAKARLLAHQNRPWSNPSAAEVYRQQYEAKLDEIVADAGKARTPATRRQTLRSRASAISYF